MRYAYPFFALAILLSPASADPSPDYYQSVDTSDPAELRRTLSALISSHTCYPYSLKGDEKVDTWDIVERADEDPDNPAYMIDVYRGMSLRKRAERGKRYHREHVWPKSYGFPRYVRSNCAYTDAHHLFIAYGPYNSSRSNKPFGTCDASCNEKPVVNAPVAGGYPGLSNWTRGGKARVWEVRVERRGDLARALFYMDVRYEGVGKDPQLILTNDRSKLVSHKKNQRVGYMGFLTTLLEWHEQDPPSDFERTRNDIVEKFQKNRNPFVDNPQWVGILYADER